jgi:uncharacterized phage-associated protein
MHYLGFITKIRDPQKEERMSKMPKYRTCMKTIELANFILSLDQSEEADITPIKLQKLLYFAHGFHLAVFGAPLIGENFEAWKHGPVVKDIYETFSTFGKKHIKYDGSPNLSIDGKNNYEVISNEEIKTYFITQKEQFIKMIEDIEDEDFVQGFDKSKYKDFVDFETV